MISEVIYKRDSAGRLWSWQYEVEGDKWRTIYGLVGGSLMKSGWVVCTPKSQPTAEAQAQFEADAELKKKLDREYRRTEAELNAVPKGPMLAKDFSKCPPIKFPVYSQPKLDGIRMLLSKDAALTRELQPHHPHVVAHIREALAHVFEKHPNLVLDGELYNHEFKDDFNSIASMVRRQHVTDDVLERVRNCVQFHVYDMPSSRYGFKGRNFALFGMFQVYNLTRGDCPVKYVPTSGVKSREQLDGLYESYLEEGYEGQMVRLDMPYEADKRSKGLLKRKEFVTEEYFIHDIQEGEGNWAGAAKTIVFLLEDGRTCGASLKGTYEFGQKLLAEKDQYLKPGAMVTIRRFKQLTPDGRPRFPVAIDFHPEGRRD